MTKRDIGELEGQLKNLENKRRKIEEEIKDKRREIECAKGASSIVELLGIPCGGMRYALQDMTIRVRQTIRDREGCDCRMRTCILIQVDGLSYKHKGCGCGDLENIKLDTDEENLCEEDLHEHLGYDGFWIGYGPYYYDNADEWREHVRENLGRDPDLISKEEEDRLNEEARKTENERLERVRKVSGEAYADETAYTSLMKERASPLVALFFAIRRFFLSL